MVRVAYNDRTTVPQRRVAVAQSRRMRLSAGLLQVGSWRPSSSRYGHAKAGACQDLERCTNLKQSRCNVLASPINGRIVRIMQGCHVCAVVFNLPVRRMGQRSSDLQP